MKVAFVYINNERNVGRGAGYVAGAVVAAGHKLRFFDTYYTPIEAVAEEVQRENYDVLMISAMTMLFPEAVRLCKLVKAVSTVPVLLGGVHPTIMGPELLDKHPEIDYLCVGEGESVAVDFLRHLGSEKLSEVPNLAYRRGGRSHGNPVRPPEDLANLPRFPWHFFPRESIIQEGQGFLYVDATRGCPYNCTYCCNGVYLRHYGKRYLRFRPVQAVIEELAYLEQAYRPQLFYFGDEMILSDTKYALELFQAIRRDLAVPYGCMARVESVRPEIVSVMAETGCQYMGMGIECGDAEFRRKHLNRTTSNQEIAAAFALAKKAGIFTTSFNMIGYPFPNDDLLTGNTVEINQQIRPDYVQVSIFYPFPGTKLYQYCVDHDLVDPEKMANVRDYFDESVLRGVSLREKKDVLAKRFNPSGFQFQPRKIQKTERGKAKARSTKRCLRKRVLMLSPDHLMIDRRILQEAHTLSEEGYDVSVISGFECPSEEHYHHNGVSIHRYSYNHSGAQPAQGSRLLSGMQRLKPILRRLLGYWLAPIRGNSHWSRFALRYAGQFPADIVHVHDLPLLWLGTHLAKEWEAKLVYDAHEIYHVHGSLTPGRKRWLRKEERRYMKQVDLFITVNSAIGEYFEKRYGVSAQILSNCVNRIPQESLVNARDRLREKASLPSTCQVVLYQGWFSAERNLERLVCSAERFPENTYLVLIGYGAHEESLRQRGDGQAWRDRVRFIGRVEPEELLTLTGGADLGVIPYLPVDINHRLLSQQFFEYVQAGVPVLAHDLPFFRKMAKTYGVVSLADLSTVKGMANGINALIGNENHLSLMRRACRKAAEVLNWEAEAKKLVEVYAKLAEPIAGKD